MRTAITLLILFTLTACSTANEPATNTAMQDIDRFVAKTLQTLPELPSIGLAVVHDDKIYARAYGYADVARRVPADANTGYYNGSNTKAYTAVVVAMLAAEGKVDLDAPVTKYIPELQFPESIQPSQVTLRRFLSHTSAIDNFGVTLRTAFSGEHTPQELVRILGMSKPFKEGFRYDNLGYVVASLVIERVTGRKWQDVLDERLFEPLGMQRTTAYMSEARKAPLALPYDMNGKGEMQFIEFGWKADSVMHAAGGIVTTPADLGKFLQANLTQGRVGGRQVVPASALAETHRQQTPAKRDSFLFDGTGYGFGWYQSDLHGEKLLYHGGGYEGWRSVYSFLPERRIAVGALTNAGISHSPLELVSAYAYDRLMNVENVDAIYDEKLAQIRARWDTVRKNHIADAEKRAGRTWTLTRPRNVYAGRYDSPTFGTLTIEQRGETLVASIGRLSATLEPFTDPDSARVELIPGSGDVLQFRLSADGAPEAVKWGDEVFVRR